MRRTERQVSSLQEIGRIIASGTYCNVALCDGSEPYVVPVCFGHEDGWLYFHCAAAGRKLDLLRKNGRVCFSIVADAKIVLADGACQCACQYRSVIGTGQASVLEDPQLRKAGLDAIMRHYAGDKPFEYGEMALAKTVVVGIRIQSLSGKKAE